MNYAQKQKFLPILAPVDIAGVATATQYVDLKQINSAEILINFGVVTGDSATVTLECSTAGTSNATEHAVPFSYRLSSAVGTDSMGAITDATSDGATVAATDDGKMLVIEVDPRAITSANGSYRYVRAVVTPGGSMTVCLVDANVIAEVRYSLDSMISST